MKDKKMLEYVCTPKEFVEDVVELNIKLKGGDALILSDLLTFERKELKETLAEGDPHEKYTRKQMDVYSLTASQIRKNLIKKKVYGVGDRIKEALSDL